MFALTQHNQVVLDSVNDKFNKTDRMWHKFQQSMKVQEGLI